MSLSIAQLQEVTPSVFTTEPSPKMSQKYNFVPTFEILENFEKEGWQVSSAKQVGKGRYSTHELRLRNGGLPQVGDSLIEAIIRNSHDGLTSLSVKAGLHRLVCSNGLTVPVSVASAFNIRHMNVDLSAVRQVTDEFAEKLPLIGQSMGKMESTMMSEGQINDFVTKAGIIRWERGGMPTSIKVEDIIQPLRDGDKGNSVWKTFNVVQEKFVRGGIKYQTKKNRYTAMRELNNIHAINKINTQLWELAESYC
jgi:hypothetical protein